MTSIRPAVPADAAAVLAVRLDSWEAAYGPLLPAHVWAQRRRDADPARMADGIADGLRGLVAEVDGASGPTIVAYSFFGACRDDDLPEAVEIYAIYAHPDVWSTGVGRTLMSATVGELTVRPVALWVLEDNPRARRFYERAGFAADGTVKPAAMPGGVELPELRYRLG